MRVIAGEFRSRLLKSLPGLETRPTPDRVRESLFNVLAPRIEGAVFLDAYAGTGAVGIEALSRGAERVIFLEKSAAAVKVIHQNLAALGVEERAQVLSGPVSAHLERQRADIVFLDPPYEMEREYAKALAILGRTAPPLVVVQHSKHFRPEERYQDLRRYRTLKQGENWLSFYEAFL